MNQMEEAWDKAVRIKPIRLPSSKEVLHSLVESFDPLEVPANEPQASPEPQPAPQAPPLTQPQPEEKKSSWVAWTVGTVVAALGLLAYLAALDD